MPTAANLIKLCGNFLVAAGFAMPLALKDIRSMLAAADANAVPMPIGSLVRDHFISGIARGGAGQDWSGLAGVAAKDAGL